MKSPSPVVLMHFRKVCHKCNKEKSLNLFMKDSPSQKRHVCKECNASHVKEWQKKNTEKAALKAQRYQMRVRHKITAKEYLQMFTEQKGLCALCGDSQYNMKQSLHVDHCHLTNKVRGLLCRNCNMGLGTFCDSEEFLQRAIEYLRKHKP